MTREWVYRIVCTVLFLAVMIPLRYGLHLLKQTHDTALMLEVCIPALLVMFLIAFIVDKREGRY